jgi:hypothetical protein
MVKKNLTIEIPKPIIEKIIVKPYRLPSKIKKIKPHIPPPVDSNFNNLKI